MPLYITGLGLQKRLSVLKKKYCRYSDKVIPRSRTVYDMCLIVDIDIDVCYNVLVTRARASAILGPTQRPSRAQGISCVRGHAGYSGPRAERFCCLRMQL